MLLQVVAVASLPLIPGQPIRLLGGEIFAVAAIVLLVAIRLQYTYLRGLETQYRSITKRMVMLNRLAVAMIALAGLMLLLRGDGVGMYLLPPGILLSFFAAGANSWVLLIEINR